MTTFGNGNIKRVIVGVAVGLIVLLVSGLIAAILNDGNRITVLETQMMTIGRALETNRVENNQAHEKTRQPVHRTPEGSGEEVTLNPKQMRFVQEYLIDLNATQAAIRAGYIANRHGVTGCRLLTKANVQAEITGGQEGTCEQKTGITQERILEELAIVGFSDIENYLDIDPDTGGIRAKGFDDAHARGRSRALEMVKEDRVIRKRTRRATIQSSTPRSLQDAR